MLEPDFLEPERLRAFVAVAEARSFTRAAERLHIAQPSVSTQVRRLEETVGRLLFRRLPGTVELTRDGEAMLGYARELLEVLGRARRQFAQPPLEGSVRLGIIDDFNLTALPEILGHLRRRHARFELFVVTGTSANLLPQLRAGELDLILTKRLAGGSDGELIAPQTLVWVGQPGVLEREAGVVPLVLTPPGTVPREIVLAALRQAGRRWSVRFEAATITGLRAAVLAGLGITALGVGMMPPDLVPLPEGGSLPALAGAEFVLAINPDSRDPVVTTFADLLRRVAPVILGRLEEEQTDPP